MGWKPRDLIVIDTFDEWKPFLLAAREARLQEVHWALDPLDFRLIGQVVRAKRGPLWTYAHIRTGGDLSVDDDGVPHQVRLDRAMRIRTKRIDLRAPSGALVCRTRSSHASPCTAPPTKGGTRARTVKRGSTNRKRCCGRGGGAGGRAHCQLCMTWTPFPHWLRPVTAGTCGWFDERARMGCRAYRALMPRPPPRRVLSAVDGLVDPAWWRSRQDDYLAVATSVSIPRSPLNVIDQLEWARRSLAHTFEVGVLDDEVVAAWCRRIDGWLDCADFDILRLLTLWHGYRDDLPASVIAAVERRLVDFRYWFTDPGPPEGVVDERWYWSENHRLIFAACEYLAGQALPDATFPRTGMTGTQHRERASAAIVEWCDEKVRFGFSEWHSDAYYEKDLAPLVALVEFADDPAMAERAATFADLVLLDLALHSIRDNNGSTHGRSYMRFKATAPTQAVFSAMKLCFDRTDAPWPLDDGDERELLPLTEGATFLARATTYRPPDVVRRIAGSTQELVDREGMGVALDPGEPLCDDPQRADGLSYTDPDMVSFWWDRGALTPWQLVPLAFDTLERHDLWDSKLFTYFRRLRDGFGGDVAAIRASAHSMHRMMNAGLLERVESYTWRNGHAMVSTAQAYRPGCAGYQHHISQATLDEHAVVFTTHPGGKPSTRQGDYLDHDRFWTGSATLPLAVQHRRVAFHAYMPGFPSVEDGVLRAFRYTDYTHAYFPTERFDEIREDGWVFGRRRDGYVALWSWRPATWRDHDPADVFTNGLVERFELVAAGGPDNVWILEVGDVERWGSFEAFCSAVGDAAIEVVDHGWDADGAHLGFDVTYPSPAEGVLRVTAGAELFVDGEQVAIDGYPRFDNPFVFSNEGEPVLRISDGVDAFVLDLAAGTRTWAGS